MVTLLYGKIFSVYSITFVCAIHGLLNFLHAWMTVNMYANKNTWGVKKCEAKKNQHPKSLISTKAKKFVNESMT